MTLSSETRFDTGAATHVGKVRLQNEDNYFHVARRENGVWAIADGMGGHEAGGLASAAVVEAFRRVAQPASEAALLDDCASSVTEANATIRAIAAERGFEVIGTTVVALLIFGRRFDCLWAGDSRMYLIRDGAIARITRDHSEAQELIDQGLLSEEDARTWPRRNIITRAIGVFEEPGLDLRQGEVKPGDVFVLCSDGLTAHVDDEEIAFHVAHTDAQEACAKLIRVTLERGARDNVTVVVVRYMPELGTVVLPAGSANRGPV
jgi:serine/threonine protein phosphatase PrpC